MRTLPPLPSVIALYLELLCLPLGDPARNQTALCELRDEIAERMGMDETEVQEHFERARIKRMTATPARGAIR